MPQREAGESIYGQADPTYGGYEGDQNQQADQTYARQQFEPPYQSPPGEEMAGKLYVPANNNKNVLRLIAFGMAIVALILFAVICLIFVGGTGGWISFCAACLATFIMATVAIDKIK